MEVHLQDICTEINLHSMKHKISKVISKVTKFQRVMHEENI